LSADHSNRLYKQSLRLVAIVHTDEFCKLGPKIGCHGNVPQHLWTPI